MELLASALMRGDPLAVAERQVRRSVGTDCRVARLMAVILA